MSDPFTFFAMKGSRGDVRAISILLKKVSFLDIDFRFYQSIKTKKQKK